MKSVGRTGKRKPVKAPKSTTVLQPQHAIRPDVMDAFEQSVTRNRDLLKRLAK